MRFCGLKKESIVSIFAALNENITVNCLDISENEMGD